MFFWKLRYFYRCRNANNNAELLYFGRLAGAHFCMFWILINIPHQKYVQNYWMQAKPTQGLSLMLHWDIFASFKFYFTVRWPQRRNDTLKFKKPSWVIQNVQKCVAAFIPKYSHSEFLLAFLHRPRYRNFPPKNLIAPTSGIPKRLRTSKSVENLLTYCLWTESKIKKNAWYLK